MAGARDERLPYEPESGLIVGSDASVELYPGRSLGVARFGSPTVNVTAVATDRPDLASMEGQLYSLRGEPSEGGTVSGGERAPETN